jgi:hypothetical protein
MLFAYTIRSQTVRRPTACTTDRACQTVHSGWFTLLLDQSKLLQQQPVSYQRVLTQACHNRLDKPQTRG